MVKRYTALKAVTDSRYGDTFMPPTEHLGKTLSDPTNQKALVSALEMARLGLAYLEGLFIEATKLPQHS